MSASTVALLCGVFRFLCTVQLYIREIHGDLLIKRYALDVVGTLDVRIVSLGDVIV